MSGAALLISRAPYSISLFHFILQALSLLMLPLVIIMTDISVLGVKGVHSNLFSLPADHFDSTAMTIARVLLASLITCGYIVVTEVFAIKIHSGHAAGGIIKAWFCVVLPTLSTVAVGPTLAFILCDTAHFVSSTNSTVDIALISVYCIMCVAVAAVASFIPNIYLYSPGVARPRPTTATHSAITQLQSAFLLLLVPVAISPVALAVISVHPAVSATICSIGLTIIGLAHAIHQQYTMVTSNAVLAGVAGLSAALTLFIRGFSPIALLYALIFPPVLVIIACWPLLAPLLLRNFIAEVQAAAPSVSVTPPRLIPSFVLDVLLRRQIHAVTAAKDATTASTKRLPVALPGFNGLDQFGPPPHELVAPEDQGPTDRLFALFQHVLAHHRRSMRLHLTFGLAMLTVRPASIEYGLQILEEVTNHSSTTRVMLDVHYSIFFIYKSKLDAMATGGHAGVRHERRRKVAATKKARLELLANRKALWTAVVDGKHKMTTARLAKLMDLLDIDAGLAAEIQESFRSLLTQATPNVLREYSTYLTECLALEDRAEDYLVTADEMESAGRGNMTVAAAELPEDGTRDGSMFGGLIRGRTELRCLIGLIGAGALGVAILSCLYGMVTVMLPHLHWLFYGVAGLRLSTFEARIGASVYQKGNNPGLLLSQSVMPPYLIPCVLYGARPNEMQDVLGLFRNTIQLMADSELTNDKIIAWQATQEPYSIDLNLGSELSTETIMQVVTAAISGGVEAFNSMPVTVDLATGTRQTTLANAVVDFFSILDGIAADNLLNIPPNATHVVPVVDSAVYANDLQQLMRSADSLEDAMVDIFRTMFMASTDFPLQIVAATLLALPVFCVALVGLMYCFFIQPLLRDTQTLVGMVQLAVALPDPVLADLTGKARGSDASSLPFPIQGAPASSDEDLTDAVTMQRWAGTPVAGGRPRAGTFGDRTDNSDLSLTMADPTPTRLPQWRRMSWKIVLSKIALVGPRAVCWGGLAMGVLISVMAVIILQVFTIGRATTAGYMLYNTLIASVEVTSRAAETLLVAGDTGSYDPTLLSAFENAVTKFNQGKVWLMTTSPEVEADWIPQRSGVSKLLNQVATTVTSPSWTGGPGEDALISILNNPSCPLIDMAPDVCAPYDDEDFQGLIEMMTTMLSAFEYVLAAPATMWTTGNMAQDYSGMMMNYVNQGVMPNLIRLIDIIRDRFDGTVSLAGNICLSGMAAIVCILAVTHIFLFRRQTVKVIRQKARLRHMLTTAYLLNRHRLPDKMAAKVRKVCDGRLTVEDSWTEEG